MAKFNPKTRDGSKKPDTINYMDEPAFSYDDKIALIGILLTSFAEDSYYESATKTTSRLKDLIAKVKDKKFIAKASIFARDTFNMRSITHIAAGELAKHVKGEEWLKNYFDKVTIRVDDMTEILSYYLNTHKRPIPNSLKKGLAKAFGKFDKYQLAKYRGENKALKLVDLVNLVHPKPTQKNAEALKELIANKLKSTDTWESKLTQAGQKAKTEEEVLENKKEAWVDLIKSQKIGYFALVRNLRNIYEQAPEVLDEACEMLVSDKYIGKSRILPFRYFSAYQEIEKLKTSGKFESEQANINKILNALEVAITKSVKNIPLLKGKTLILSDNSGSMRGDSGGHSRVSRYSNTKTSDIANLFAIMYWSRCNDTLVGLFGDRLIHPTLNRNAGIFENVKLIDSAAEKCGASTETGIFTMLEKMIAEKIIVDTIIVFSDCQIGDGCQWYDTSRRKHGPEFNKLYKEYKSINPNVVAYTIDLKGYGTTVFDGSVNKIFGWSEKIFDVMQIMSQDKKALINEIEKVEI